MITEDPYWLFFTSAQTLLGESSNERGLFNLYSYPHQTSHGYMSQTSMRPHKGLTVLRALTLINQPHTLHGYSINYYDCHDTNKITTYEIGRACEPYIIGNNTSPKYTLLKDKSITKISSFSCKIMQTTLTEYCRAYSHQKLVRILDIQLSVFITPSHCLDLIHQQLFVILGRKLENIKICVVNVIKSYDLGTISAKDDKVSCKGQTQHNGINTVNDNLQVSQY